MPTAPPGCARSLSNASPASVARAPPRDEHTESRRGSEPTMQDIGGRPTLPQSTSAPSVATTTTLRAVHRNESVRSSLTPRGRAYQACERCRKARTKCSGTRPCERCDEKKFKCEYAGQARHSQVQDRASMAGEEGIGIRHIEQQYRRDTRRSPSRIRHNPVSEDIVASHPPTSVHGSSSHAYQVALIPTRGLSRNRSSTLPSHRRNLPYPPSFIRNDVASHSDVNLYTAPHIDSSSMHAHSEHGHAFSFGNSHITVHQGWREPIIDDRPYTGSSETSLSSGRFDHSPAHRVVRLPFPGSIHAPFTASRGFIAQRKTAIIDAVEDWRLAQLPTTFDRNDIHPEHPTHESTHRAAAAYFPPTTDDVRRILEDASIGCPRGRERAYSLPALRIETTSSDAGPHIVTLPSFSQLFARADERRLR